LASFQALNASNAQARQFSEMLLGPAPLQSQFSNDHGYALG
jgi:hypothetical protein